MFKTIKSLFPICRSITGPGIKYYLSYLEKFVPDFRRVKFSSGTKVYDWKIPKEWHIHDSYIQDLQTKKKFKKFKKNNLHVLNFSSPINKIVNKEELFKHIYSLKSQPTAIPYVTSYYKKNWGFCLNKNEKKKLNKKKYKIFINNKFKKGTLDLSHALFTGKSKKEIFFSSYLCHPSMANNELSGPTVLTELAKFIKNKKNLRFSYRFVILPETIGSICYIKKYYRILKKRMLCGFNVSCVGDNGNFSIIESPSGETLADFSLKEVIKNKRKFKKYSFNERGSDERQYCAPGIELPVCGFSRSKYGEYRQYHTSLDNLNFISARGLKSSLNVLKKIVESFENKKSWYIIPKSKFNCEPNLGKRNLYFNVSEKKNYKSLSLRKNLIAYSDGKKNLLQISKVINQPIKKILKEMKLLLKKGVLKTS